MGVINLKHNNYIEGPRITIGLVVFNGESYIRDFMHSVLMQSYKNIELVVVDGGSDDGTQEILQDYSDHISILIREPDNGIYDAMNKVCSLATGDWLIFMGCDDRLLDTLSNMAQLLTNRECVYYGDVIARSYGKIYGGEFSKYKLLSNNICHQAIFYPSLIYKKHRYSLRYPLMADYVYNLVLFSMSVPFVYTGIVVSLFNNEGRSTIGDDIFERDRLKLIRTLFGTHYMLFVLLRNFYNRLLQFTLKKLLRS
jgi:glycosyltransferase involved in cell wall biosynthesis